MREHSTNAPTGQAPSAVVERQSEEGLRDILSRKLIRFDTLDPPLRILAFIALALLALVIVLVMTRDLPQPQVLLYFGYTVMAAFAVLYLTSLHAQGFALPSSESLDDSLYAEVGLLVLGIAVSFMRGCRLRRLRELSEQT